MHDVVPRSAAALSFLLIILSACGGGDLTLPDGGDPGEGDPDGATAAIRIERSVPNPSDVGRAVRFEVAFRDGPPGGDPPAPFEIRATTGERCTGHDRDLHCEIVFDSPGAREVVAQWSGAASEAEAVSAPVAHVVHDVPDPTRTIIGVGPDPSPVGSAVTVWITVRGEGGMPARGRVVVYGPGTRACGDGPVAETVELDGSGQATVEVRGLPEGWHYFRGCFTGSPGFSPSEDGASVTITSR